MAQLFCSSVRSLPSPNIFYLIWLFHDKQIFQIWRNFQFFRLYLFAFLGIRYVLRYKFQQISATVNGCCRPQLRCGKVVFFTPVCHSVYGGREWQTPPPREQTAPQVHTPWEQIPPLHSAFWEIRATRGW